MSHHIATFPLGRRQFLLASSLGIASLSSVTAAEKEPSGQMKVAVIGHTGRGNYGHGIDSVWLSIPETRIVAVADPDEKGRTNAARKLGSDQNGPVKPFADYHAMLKEVQPDIVAVGPRHIDQHADMCLAAIENGAKGVYVEKPFCRTPAEADAIVAACKKTGAKLAIAHRNRYHPALSAVAKVVKEGAIGRLLEIRARGKEDQRGGCLDLWVLGSHTFDLCRYFAGDALSCSAQIYAGDRLAVPADVVEGSEGVGPLAGNRLHARFEMSAGIPMFFDSIKEAGTRAAGFGVQLIGNKGVIDLRVDAQTIAHICAGNPFQPTKTPRTWKPITSAGIDQPEPLTKAGFEVSHHISAVRDLVASIEEDRAPLCSAVEGAAVIEMIHAVFASHTQQGRSVSLPLASRTHPFTDWAAS